MKKYRKKINKQSPEYLVEMAKWDEDVAVNWIWARLEEGENEASKAFFSNKIWYDNRALCLGPYKVGKRQLQHFRVHVNIEKEKGLVQFGNLKSIFWYPLMHSASLPALCNLSLHGDNNKGIFWFLPHDYGREISLARRDNRD